MRKKMELKDGFIAGFEPRFTSIAKDSERYFDALFGMHEEGQISRTEVLELSAQGNRWINEQYLARDHLDLVLLVSGMLLLAHLYCYGRSSS